MSASAPDMAVPQFIPADASASAGPASGSSGRPYGRLSIFTLLDDKAAEFDQLSEHAAEGIRLYEPDTLVYVIHVVPKAPMQRIIYEIYRDRAAFESHERQPHIQRFVDDRKACVLATNIIDLRLKYAKVAALGAPQPSQASPQSWAPRELESGNAPGGNQYHGAGRDGYGGQYPGAANGQRPDAANGYSGAANGRHASGGDDWFQASDQGQRYGGG
jgi:quinol monooxygenase YgiN